MSFNEEEFLAKYMKEEVGLTAYSPQKNYTDTCLKYGKAYHTNELIGESNKIIDHDMQANESAYIRFLTNRIKKFKNDLEDGERNSTDFPIVDWRLLANQEETRFLMRDFYKLAAKTIEGIMSESNDYNKTIVLSLYNLNAEEYSKILGNFKDPNNFVKIAQEISKNRIEIFESSDFNPMESIINEGNIGFLDVALKNENIKTMILNGKIKGINKISIDGNLVRRLASVFDIEKKNGIVSCIMYLNNNSLSDKMMDDMSLCNLTSHTDINKIQPSDKLSFMDIYAFSKNKIFIFNDRNAEIREKFKPKENKVDHRFENGFPKRTI